MKRIDRTSLCTLVIALFVFVSTAGAQTQQLPPALRLAVGHWQVINDEGKPGGQVETYLENGMLFGRVTQLRPGRLPGAVCDKCIGDLKDQPIQGLLILRNFKPQAEDWAGGTVVDPENGKQYRGKIWTVGEDTLFLRGFVGISMLGRTQHWKRVHP